MSHEATVLIELGAVVLALGVIARLAHRCRISPIPLYLLAGLAFGHGGVLPLNATEEFISIGADIGVILLLLLLGLEYSSHELLGNLRAGAFGGAVDAVCNFAPGFITGLLLGWKPLTAVVMGGVTYVSSSGIIAKTLTDLGRLGNRETPVVLSLLVLEDLAMAVYLPVVASLLSQGDIRSALVPVLIAVSFGVVVLICAVKYGPAFSRLLTTNNDEVLLLMVLGFTLLVAGVAEGWHVSAGVGAFLVGIALSGNVAVGAHELLSPLRDLFAAVFFVFFGLRTDPTQIPDVLLVALALAIVTSFTKVFTGWWAARRAGIGPRGRLRAGVGMIPRGEFSIVIAGIAVSAGLETDLGPLAATYVLLLAIAGPILARFTGTHKKRPKPAVKPKPAIANA